MVQLKTKRLLLRESIVEDAPVLYEMTNDPEVMKYTGDVMFKSVEETKELIRNYPDYQKYTYGRWTTIIKETNEIIGWCGLKYIEDLKETDLGFRFMKKYWNRGYGTEASIACLQHGFEQLGMQQIIAQVYKDNGASQRVLQKLGFTYWKELYDKDDSWLVFRIKKEEFTG